jgi:pyruvate dehydrogenase E2 component (dihydrolipoamide acetyltransferase)
VATAADRRLDSAPARPSAGTPVGVSPRAARLASARGVDLARVGGTGPGGRIVERDVLAAVAAGRVGSAALPTSSAAPPAAPAAAEPVRFGPPTGPGPSALPVDEEAPRPLDRLRRTIAERLMSGWATTPQFRVTVAADVTSLLDLRSELRNVGHDLSLTDFVLTATAQTLVEFPDLNARTDGVLLWPRRRVNLGLAVAVPSGLLVPVIRDADRWSLLQIHTLAVRLVEAARAGSLGPDELTGSTFTVWNLGMLGVESFEAIVNPGEAACLAVGSASPEAVAVGDGIGIRTIMRLTLSADHRIVDGELAARFLGALRRRLVDVPGWRVLLDRA